MMKEKKSLDDLLGGLTVRQALYRQARMSLFSARIFQSSSPDQALRFLWIAASQRATAQAYVPLFDRGDSLCRAVCGRYLGGEDIDSIAEDYAAPRMDVHLVLRRYLRIRRPSEMK